MIYLGVYDTYTVGYGTSTEYLQSIYQHITFMPNDLSEFVNSGNYCPIQTPTVASHAFMPHPSDACILCFLLVSVGVGVLVVLHGHRGVIIRILRRLGHLTTSVGV